MVCIFVLVSYMVVHCKNKTVHKSSNDFYSRKILIKIILLASWLDYIATYIRNKNIVLHLFLGNKISARDT